jgi:translation initiation factor IF-2
VLVSTPSTAGPVLPRVHVDNRRPRATAAPPSIAVVAPLARAAAPAAPAINVDPPPAAPATPAARPEPTRESVLAAYQHAIRSVPAAPAAPPAPPARVAKPAPHTTVSMLARSASSAPAPPTATLVTPFGVSRLQRVETETADVPAMNRTTRDEAPKPEPPDLDLLADYVLERLRHELRDGRERLGFLLDDFR